jgi:hypothetical protein
MTEEKTISRTEANIGTGQIKNKNMTIKEITEKAKAELKDLTGFGASSVVSVKKEGEEWKVVVELLEKTGIPDRMDILGIYEIRMSPMGDVSSYDRKGLRKRGDTAGQETEEEQP